MDGDGEQTSGLLQTLSKKIEGSWEQVDEDRKMFFRGLRSLEAGDVNEASKIFRRAARQCPAPFSTMARMAQGRCEVVRGRQGVALRIFRGVATSDAPDSLRKLAWMEVADLARERKDSELLKKARHAISADGMLQPGRS